MSSWCDGTTASCGASRRVGQNNEPNRRGGAAAAAADCAAAAFARSDANAAADVRGANGDGLGDGDVENAACLTGLESDASGALAVCGMQRRRCNATRVADRTRSMSAACRFELINV